MTELPISETLERARTMVKCREFFLPENVAVAQALIDLHAKLERADAGARVAQDHLLEALELVSKKTKAAEKAEAERDALREAAALALDYCDYEHVRNVLRAALSHKDEGSTGGGSDGGGNAGLAGNGE